MREYRVWCKNKEEWETNLTALMNTGELFHVNTLINEKYKLQPLKPETHIVEFYTGLIDKNGEKIFESDKGILYGEEHTVSYEDGSYVFKNDTGTVFKEYNTRSRIPDINYGENEIVGFEITGNIHE